MSLNSKNIFSILGVMAFLTIVGCGPTGTKPDTTPEQTSINGGKGPFPRCDMLIEVPALYGYYEGDCQKGIARGKDTYDGEFQNGYPHGQGTYTWSDGATFTGRFEHGVPQVPHQGCEVTIPRLRGQYQGQCQNNKAHGHGKTKGIDSYEGQFQNGVPHGKGTYTWHNGDRYTGPFKAGEPDGCGVVESKEGKEEFNCNE
jgi:hypothetical protein